MAFWAICKIYLRTVLAVLLRSYEGNLLMFLSLLLLIVLLAGVTLLVQRRATGLTDGLGFPAAEAEFSSFPTKCKAFLVMSIQILSMKVPARINFGDQKECRRT